MQRNHHFVVLYSLVGLLVFVFALGQAQRTQAQGPQPQAAQAAQLGTAFTYQGQLKKSGGPHTGACAMQFSLWDALSGGTQIGSTQTVNPVNVANGLFNAQLNFGDQFRGDARWLQIAVQCAGDVSATTLAPRTAINPTPYALSLRPGARIEGAVDYGATGEAALRVTNRSTNFPIGVYGIATDTTGTAIGVAGNNASPDGYAVYGYSTNGGRGVFGDSASGTGVYGLSSSSAGVIGQSTTGTGVYGNTTGGWGVHGNSTTNAGVVGGSTDYVGVYGSSTNGGGIYGTGPVVGTEGYSAAGTGVYGHSGSGMGVDAASTSGTGVFGHSLTGRGVDGFTSVGVEGVYGRSNRSDGIGVHGYTNGNSAIGVWGESPNNTGVYGLSTSGSGVWGKSTNGFAMRSEGNATQSLGAGGWVKAMVLVEPGQPAGQQITRCYNSQATGTAVSTPPCGMSLSSSSLGQWTVTFPFSVAGRFALGSIADGLQCATIERMCIIQVGIPSGTYVSAYIQYADTHAYTNAAFVLVLF